jgi:peptide/nickel transport system substrate-binding protein
VKKLSPVLAVVVLAVLALSFSACGSSSDDSGDSKGGTLKVSFAAFPDYLDPQLSYTSEGWSAMYNTYIPLLTYAHAEGNEGSEVIPGLAEDLPEKSNGGKTYELTLVDGLKYSDGTPVKASDFKSTVERLFELESGASPFFSDIVGAEDFLEGKASSIAGIETDDATGRITIDLNSPRGSFESELAMPFVALVPAETPAKPQTANPPPATGPYEIVESNPGRGWSYARNPQWEKNNADLLPDLPGGHVDRIDVTVVSNQSTQVNDVEQGKTNWMFDPLPADRVAAVKQKYEGKQLRVVPSISTYFFFFNTTRAPFDDLKVRQAINHAIDPAALERIYAGEIAAGQQILPPGMPGYEKFELYPFDLAKAKEMIAEANPSDKEITVWTNNLSPNDEASEYYEGVLRDLGFDVTLKVINPDNYFTLIGNTSTPDLDTGWLNWFEDYPHPNDFFQPLLSGESIAPTNNTNIAQFDDPDVNAKITELSEKELTPEVEAEYAQLDREVMEQAPWAPFGNRSLTLFVSSDIDFDKVVWNPTFSGDLTSFQFK